MWIVLGLLIGACFGVVWGRVLSPNRSVLATGALSIIALVAVWFALSAPQTVQLGVMLAGLATVIIAPFAAAHFLKQGDVASALPYGERLRFWFAPERRKAAGHTEDGAAL